MIYKDLHNYLPVQQLLTKEKNMLEKNYLNPEDAARFGFRQKGTYKASRKSETAVSAVLFGVMIVAAVLIIGAMASFARTMITTSIEPGNVMLFYLLTSAFGSVVGVTADVLIMLLISPMRKKLPSATPEKRPPTRFITAMCARCISSRDLFLNRASGIM